MATDTRVANLIINKGLTKAELNEKYQQGLIGDNELSVVDTEETVFQVNEMPTASAANVDSIVQYAGATTEDYTQGYFYQCEATYADPTVTASQTSGSDLSDITVDKDVYIQVMQPEEGDSVDFVAGVMDDYVTPTSFEMGGEQFTLEMRTFLNYCKLNVYSGDWSTDVVNVSINYDADNDMWTITAMDAGYNVLGSAGGMTPQSAGIMYTVLPSMGNYIVDLTYTPQQLVWRVDGAIIAYNDLSSVGISYTGTPVTGDTITATYIGRTISGYYWNQINVQPGGGGGDTSIDWKTSVDLPSTYNSGMWYCAPAFVVSGGLPDGTYEMYYQVKTRSNTFERSAPAGVATFKIVVRLYYENDWPTMVGTIAPVINGEWWPSNNYVISSQNLYNVFHLDQNNNFIVDGKNYLPFISDLGDYGNMYVPDCFRLSAIKNVDTGDEYIATGTAPDGNFPYYGRDYGGTLAMSNLQQQQDIPVYYLSAVLSFSDNDQWINVGNFIPTPGHTASCSEFDASLESSNGGKWHIISENTYNSYHITVLEAAGDLANAQIGYDYNGNIFLYLNTPAGSSGTINMTISVKGASQAAWYTWASQPSGFTLFALSTVGADITPNNYGAVLQYTGTTNVNYTNGYFYKANGTPTIVQASIDCNEISSYGNIITCDVDRLISEIATYTGWDTEYVKLRLSSVSEWQCVQNTGYLYWNQWGSFGENPSMLSCFSFTGGTQTEYDTIQWVTTNYLPTHTVITNPSWDRVDVQPAIDPLPSQTGNAGKFLTTNGTNTSWSTSITYPMSIINTSESNPTTMLTLGVGSSSGNYFGIMTFSTLTRADLLLGGNSVLELRRLNLTPVSDNSFSLGYTGQQWKNIYTYKLNNGADITIPTVGGIMMLQTPTLPTASSTLEGQIYQFVGTTDSTYTNGHFYKCVSDGADPATYSWTEVSTGGGGSSYTAGTGIDITNGTISITDPVLVNNPTGTSSVNIKGSNNNQSNSVAVGSGASVTNNQGIAVGWGSQAGYDCTAVGARSVAYDDYSTAIGFGATVPYGVAYAIQLGNGTNNTSGTLAVALSTGSGWTNYELLSSDGTIPTARLTKVNSTITLTAAGWSSNTQTVNVTGMTATGVVFVSPDPTDQADYTSAGILCAAQAAGTLTFTCSTTPTNDIDVVVVML